MRPGQTARSALPFRALLFRRQIEFNNESAISLSLLREAQICRGQIFKFGAGLRVSFGVGMGEKLESFGPVVIPHGH
jgi:hypothetical protein